MSISDVNSGNLPKKYGKKVLIIKISALGDVMIGLPHIESLLSHHAGDRVWLITGPQFVEFFNNDPRIRVVVLDRKKRFSDNGVLATILWVAKQHFDYIYDLQGNGTSRRLVRFSRAGVRVGTQPRSIYTHHPAEEYTRESRQNVFERLNETLLSGGAVVASPGCSLIIPHGDEQFVEQWKREHDLVNGRYVLLHAGGSRKWRSKRWPAERFLALARRIEIAGMVCVWVGGPDDAAVNKMLAARVGFNATDAFSVLQLYRLGAGALFAVTNDSGPMHILAASGIPIYSFFGPTDWMRSHAAGQAKRVFTGDVPCSPCFKNRCPSAMGHKCMNAIGVASVFNKIFSEMLDHSPRQRPQNRSSGLELTMQ
ncbi:MAG: glycosyltransferase family 9 protein [Desulfobulbaceae bacterium]|nr:glycosyltransferase family 9 protein [Desulfobulbaceae bacterium]